MRVTLIRPPDKYQVWAGVPDIFSNNKAYLFPPLGILYLASYLKKYSRHSASVLDCLGEDLSFPEIGKRLQDEKPDVIGISTITHNIANVAKVIEIAKSGSPQSLILLGGPHVTAFPREAIQLKGVDAAIYRDGEHSFKEFLDKLEEKGDISTVKGIVLKRDDGVFINGTPLGNRINDLDSLPFPDRSSIRLERYFTPGMIKTKTATIITSRGCPYRCNFCSVDKVYRARSAGNVVDEIEECIEKYGIEEIHFVDDIFNINVNRVIEISREIIKRRLKVLWGCKANCREVTEEMLYWAKRSGCVRMHYGVETNSDFGLRSLGKETTIEQIKRAFMLTRKHKIKSIAYMIIGCPHEKTAREIIRVSKFVKGLHPDYVVYSLFTPYPDAEIFNHGVELGLWEEGCWSNYMVSPTARHSLPTIWTEHLTSNDLLKLFKFSNYNFYFSPRTLFKTFRNIKGLVELRRIFEGGVSLLKMMRLNSISGRI